MQCLFFFALVTCSTCSVSAGVYKSKDKAKPAASPEVGHSTPLHPPCSPRSSRSGESFTQVKVSSVPVKTKEAKKVRNTSISSPESSRRRWPG